MKVNNAKILKRFNSVMYDICCEHLVLPGEPGDMRQYYGVEDGVTVGWMLHEAKYWLSCYYEPGHCRHDDKFIDEYEYKIWVSETGKLKRLIKRLEKLDEDDLVIEWED